MCPTSCLPCPTNEELISRYINYFNKFGLKIDLREGGITVLEDHDVFLVVFSPIGRT